MSHIRNVWGGPLDALPMSTTDDDEEEVGYDQSAYRPPPADVSDRWLLRPRMVEKKRKKLCSRENQMLLRILALVVCMAVVTTLVVLAVTKWRHHRVVTVPDNYTDALHKALMFFNAQRSGKLPKQNNVSWRGNSGLKDEVVGGYYDAGDTVKYSFPASFSMTILSWSVIEYSAKYEAAGELDHVKEIIRWGTDYLLETFNSSSGSSIGSIVSQVGGDNDLYCWMRPEDMDGENDLKRRAIRCNNCPALAAEMAAALASASIVFNDDDTYSKKLLGGAERLFKFATKDEGEKYSGGRDTPSSSYNSSGFWDEFLWGGTWLYFATGNSSYLQLITSDTLARKSNAFSRAPDKRIFSWDNKQVGAQLLLTRLRIFLGYGYPYEEILRRYHEHVEDFMCSLLPFFSSFQRTAGGLIELNHGTPRSLQYVVNAAFLASLFGDYLTAKLIPGWNCGSQFYTNQVLHNFSARQMDYILGQNPRGISYVVGFGNNFSQHVHHRGASIPNNKVRYGCKEGWKWRDSKRPNPNIVTGAMVGGPDKDDGFLDIRTNNNYTEPTIAGNAGLVAALVALSGVGSSKIDQNTIFQGIPPLQTYEPPSPPWTP